MPILKVSQIWLEGLDTQQSVNLGGQPQTERM